MTWRAYRATSGFSSTTAGKVTVTVTYEGKSDTFEVTIKESESMATITGIEVTTKPTKLEYEIGDSLDKTGMVVKAVKSDNTKAEIAGWTTSNLDSSAAGEKEITVTYVDGDDTFTTTFKVTVLAAKVLESISLNTTNAKTTYNYNEDLDTSGVVVTAKYDRGSDVVIPIADCTVTGYVKTTEGQQTITVTYGGQSKTYNVTVNEKAPELQSLILDTTNAKTVYEVDEEADFSGLVVKAHYDKGDDVTLTSTQYNLTGFTTETAGEKTITVSFGGVTKTFTITVNQPVNPQQFAPFARVVGGDDLVLQDNPDPEKAELEWHIRLNLAAGANVKFSLAENDADWRGASKVEGGVTVEYSAGENDNIVITNAGTYDFYVKKAANGTIYISEYNPAPQPQKTLSSIAVTTNPTKMSYITGQEFDPTGMVVTATYSDDSNATIANGNLEFVYDFSVAGTKTVTINYDGKSASLSGVTVNAPVVTPDHVMHHSLSGGEWTNTNLTVNPGNENEHMVEKELSIGDIFIFHYEGNDWRGISAMKGESPAAGSFEDDGEGNFRVTTAGTYQFLIDNDGSSPSIYITRHLIVTNLVASYGSGSEYAFVGGTIDENLVDVHYVYDDSSNGSNLANDPNTSFYILVSETPVEVDGDTVIGNEMVGTMRVYVNVDGYTGDDPYFDVTVVNPEFYIVGLGDDWDIANGTQLTIDGGDSNHYTANHVVVAANDEIKVIEQNSNKWYGNNGENYQFVSAGEYNIDFYINANNNIHIVTHEVEPLSLSTNSVTLTLGSEPTAEVTIENAYGDITITGAVGSGSVATANRVGSTITITAVGAGTTSFTVNDTRNDEVISVTVYAAPQMYLVSSVNS